MFDATALVRCDDAERRISIVVDGAQRRDYLGIVLHALRDINQSFQKIRAVERVPMPDSPNVTVTFRHLLRLEAMGQDTYIPDGSEREYRVSEVLGSVQPRRRSDEEILSILHAIREATDTRETLLEKANRVVLLEPNVFGVGININNLIDRFFPQRSTSD
jgi:hypothetical protein